MLQLPSPLPTRPRRVQLRGVPPCRAGLPSRRAAPPLRRAAHPPRRAAGAAHGLDPPPARRTGSTRAPGPYERARSNRSTHT
eukprot:scaffold20371_cov67-Phaeocystis_antarctica.AAC.1